MRSSGFKEGSILKDAATFFSYCPALIGGSLFSAIYTDDLNSRNLITLVGYGISKSNIIFAKFILAAISCAVFFGLLPIFHVAVYGALGCAAKAAQMGALYAFSLKYLLMTSAFFILSSVVAYGLQRATFAVVTYVLFGFSVVSTLLLAVLRVLNFNIYDYLLSGITDRIAAGIMSNTGSLALPFVEYFAYVTVAVALSAVAFYKKEMEF
jgi:ABC-type transport system involved in multi-copper enzyme maturation permease subunit